MPRILRTFTFWISAARKADCQAHLEIHVVPLLRAQPGCVRATAMFRTRDDGIVEVVVASTWLSMAQIEAAIGEGIDNPVGIVRPEFFLDREPKVRHTLLDAGDDRENAFLLAQVGEDTPGH